MTQTDHIPTIARVDPAGRPLEGRGRQALIAIAVIAGWMALIVLILWVHRGQDPLQPARLLGGVGLMIDQPTTEELDG